MTFTMQMRTITRNALHCNHCCLFNYNILNSIGIHKSLSYEPLSRDVLLCYLFLCFRIFLLRLFNFNNINPAAPHRIIAITFCCINYATPPNIAKIVPKIPIPCLYLINAASISSSLTTTIISLDNSIMKH
jgi:glucan phosphoethanolaminetransferase (alkaline phosphatase superfamily)